MAYRYENVTKDENQISHWLSKLYANTLKKKKTVYQKHNSQNQVAFQSQFRNPHNQTPGNTHPSQTCPIEEPNAKCLPVNLC